MRGTVIPCMTLLLSLGCDDTPPDLCTLPGDGLYATIRVLTEVYRQRITSPAGIQGALELWAGTSSASIPVGDLVCAPEPWNCGWSWHVDPDTIEWASAAIEVCDGTVSYIEANCAQFVSQYCPWSAELVELRDCRTDPGCPPVP